MVLADLVWFLAKAHLLDSCLFTVTSKGRRRGRGTFSVRPLLFFSFFLIVFKNLLIDFLEKERKIDLLFHLFMNSFVDSHMCSVGGSNP